MLIFILIPLIIAKLKKYNISYIFKTFDLFPLFIVSILYLFLQINTLLGEYKYIKYSTIIKSAFVIVLLVPIIRQKLYSQALLGSGFIAFGSILNNIVIYANGGKMPVYPTLSVLTGYCKIETLQQGIDELHILMDQSTKLNFLADYIDMGFSIMSIGDLFNHSIISIIVFYTIKSFNKKYFLNNRKISEENNGLF